MILLGTKILSFILKTFDLEIDTIYRYLILKKKLYFFGQIFMKNHFEEHPIIISQKVQKPQRYGGSKPQFLFKQGLRAGALGIHWNLFLPEATLGQRAFWAIYRRAKAKEKNVYYLHSP
jgi:hypothetical protein